MERPQKPQRNCCRICAKSASDSKDKEEYPSKEAKHHHVISHCEFKNGKPSTIEELASSEDTTFKQIFLLCFPGEAPPSLSHLTSGPPKLLVSRRRKKRKIERANAEDCVEHDEEVPSTGSKNPSPLPVESEKSEIAEGMANPAKTRRCVTPEIYLDGADKLAMRASVIYKLKCRACSTARKTSYVAKCDIVDHILQWHFDFEKGMCRLCSRNLKLKCLNEHYVDVHLQLPIAIAQTRTDQFHRLLLFCFSQTVALQLSEFVEQFHVKLDEYSRWRVRDGSRPRGSRGRGGRQNGRIPTVPRDGSRPGTSRGVGETQDATIPTVPRDGSRPRASHRGGCGKQNGRIATVPHDGSRPRASHGSGETQDATIPTVPRNDSRPRALHRGGGLTQNATIPTVPSNNRRLVRSRPQASTNVPLRKEKNAKHQNVSCSSVAVEDDKNQVAQIALHSLECTDSNNSSGRLTPNFSLSSSPSCVDFVDIDEQCSYESISAIAVFKSDEDSDTKDLVHIDAFDSESMPPSGLLHEAKEVEASKIVKEEMEWERSMMEEEQLESKSTNDLPGSLLPASASSAPAYQFHPPPSSIVGLPAEKLMEFIQAELAADDPLLSQDPDHSPSTSGSRLNNVKIKPNSFVRRIPVNFKCAICEKEVENSIPSLLKHVLLDHFSDKEPLFGCRHCSFVSKRSYYYMRMHILSSHLIPANDAETVADASFVRPEFEECVVECFPNFATVLPQNDFNLLLSLMIDTLKERKH